MITTLSLALTTASAELAAAIDRQSKPERGWTLYAWGRRCTREVERARVVRDAAAREYRDALRLVRLALSGRERAA